MVDPTDFNLRKLRGTTFKGFVQFQEPEGSVWFRLKERQTLNVTFRFNRAQHYDDAGNLTLDPAGISHSFTMTLKVTSDLFDDEFDTTSPISGTMDKKTLSYWIAKNQVHEPIDVIFVTTMETLIGPAGDTAEKFINLKFVLSPDTFGPITYGATGGSHDITVSGIVTSITEVIRDADPNQ